MASAMPESGSNLNDKKTLCRFFQKGTCIYGNNCFNSHDSTNGIKDESICKYYLLGCCVFGDNCFYKHCLPAALSSSASSSKSNDSIEGETVAESSSSKSSSSSSLTSKDVDDNNKFVTRVINKPKLAFVRLANSEDSSHEFDSPSMENKSATTPASYYEALTGTKLSNDSEEELTDLDMFDPTYIEYLNRRKELNKLASTTHVLCPYFEKLVECPFGETCYYTHGDICEYCQLACLNPNDENQREAHKQECMKQIEREMEEAFAVQRSSDKVCGICMEVVWQKENASDKRFGILKNCNHIFCLPCIRKWRASKSYENKIVKACPECRVKSDFVTPSRYWFEDEESKTKIIEEYKSKLGGTACKYFKQGDGKCPFGNKCFYLHRNKDGSLANLPDPAKRHRYNRFGDLEAYSNIVRVDFDFSDDEDEFDLLEFFRQNLLWDTETESDLSDFFEFSDEFLI